MNPNATEILVILDRSGSMGTIRQDTIGGYNTFLDAQRRVPGECRISLVQFDTVNPYDVNYFSMPLNLAPMLSEKTYEPRAGTPLLDAIGKAVTTLGETLKNIGERERPGKVLVCVITDGEENSSTHFTKQQIRDMVKHQSDVYKWEFVFLGANIDAFHEGTGLGMLGGNTMTFSPTSHGTHAAYTSLATNAANYRMGATLTAAFTDEDRKKQEELLKDNK